MNFIFTPIVDTYLGGVRTVLWMGVGLCFVSLGACIGLMILDKMGDKDRKGSDGFTVGERIQLSAVFKFPLSLYLIMIICVTFYVTIFSFITISR